MNVEVLIGGTGDDVFVFSAAATFPGTLNGGDGADTLDYSGYASAVTVDLSTNTATGINSVINTENIIGSDFDDVLMGDDNDNEITGGMGTDTLTGLGGTTAIASAMTMALTRLLKLPQVAMIRWTSRLSINP